MKKRRKAKVINEGLLSPTDEIYNLGLVVDGIPVSVARSKKASAGKKQKGRGTPKGKGK
jgi:hypothetical protein